MLLEEGKSSCKILPVINDPLFEEHISSRCSTTWIIDQAQN